MRNQKNYLLLGYCIPYSFIAIYVDAMIGSSLFYLLALACMICLCRLAIKKKLYYMVYLGTTVSAIISGVLSWWILPEKEWSWYFVPLTPIALILFLFLLVLLVQHIIVEADKKKDRG